MARIVCSQIDMGREFFQKLVTLMNEIAISQVDEAANINIPLGRASI